MKKIYYAILFGVLLGWTPLKAQIVFSSDFESWTGNTPVKWIGTQNTLEPDSVLQESTNPHGGRSACRLVNRTGLSRKFSSQGFALEAGVSYDISYWVKGGANLSSVAIFDGNNFPITTLIENLDTSAWVKRAAQFTASTTTASAELVFTLRYTKSGTEDLQFDDVLISKLSSSFFQLLDTNDISARINADGYLFNQHFMVPKGSGKHTIYESNIWIGGIDDNSQLHLAAETYGGSIGKDFFFGPITSDYSDTVYQNKYGMVWKINKSEIDFHILNFSKTGYSVPNSISTWPGNGNTLKGEMAEIAPYIDVNANGVYDPLHGDYPDIRGDQAIFFLFNDDKSTHNSQGLKLGIEVHGLAYSFADSQDSALQQTVFINYQIYNRSATKYHDVYFGSFSDMDIGYPYDDFVGCDTLLNMFYTYNAFDSDGTGTNTVYGIPAPIQGAVFLNHPMSRFLYYYNGPTITGDPLIAADFYNYLTGRWKDSTQMTFGGIGYGGTTPTKFMYSGDPTSSTGWTETSAGNYAGDRRGVMTIGPLNLNPGEKMCVDIAFPFARDYAGTNLTAVTLLRNRVQSIREFYNRQGYICNMPVVGTESIPEDSPTVTLFPNPSQGTAEIQFMNCPPDSKIEIYSLLGTLIFSKPIGSDRTTLELGSEKGMFLYLIRGKGKIISRGKLIIE